jgi:hypothetical protein
MPGKLVRGGRSKTNKNKVAMGGNGRKKQPKKTKPVKGRA